SADREQDLGGRGEQRDDPHGRNPRSLGSVRMNDHAPATGWDETARPTLAEPADAPYPPQRLAVAEHLVEVHDMLRGELGQLREMLDQVRRGLLSAGVARSGLHAMTIRQNNWTLGAYCASYCRIVNGHHALEDSGVFPHLT